MRSMKRQFDLGTLDSGFALVSPENGLKLRPQSVHHMSKTAVESALICTLIRSLISMNVRPFYFYTNFFANI